MTAQTVGGILALTGMGDCIIFCRLADSLKKAFPADQYELTILCNDSHIKLFSMFFDRVKGFPFYDMSFNPFARMRILSKLREDSFDELWDVNGCGECTPNIFISNAVCAAEKKVAYPGLLDCGRRKNICPVWLKRKIYSEIVDLPEDIHLSTVYQIFLQHVSGKVLWFEMLDFPLKKTVDIPDRYLVFVPSGSHRRNMWGADNFITLGKHLYEKRNLPIILCGASSDYSECLKIEQNLKSSNIPVINMAGRTNFMELAWLLKNTEEMFTIDTGSFHLALSLGTKVVLIAPEAVYSLYIDYPESMRENLSVHHADMACKNCGHYCYDSGCGNYPCVDAVTIDDVLESF